jgi:hypothetical protein
MMRLNV